MQAGIHVHGAAEAEEWIAEGRLLLTFEDPGERPDELLDWRAPVPIRQRNLAAGREIALKIVGDARGDGLVADRDVHLIVVFERSIVEIQSRIEQLRQQNQQLQQKLDKMQSSHESRLQRLERGSAKAPSPRASQAKP